MLTDLPFKTQALYFHSSASHPHYPPFHVRSPSLPSSLPDTHTPCFLERALLRQLLILPAAFYSEGRVPVLSSRQMVTGWLAGPVDTWHVGRLQTVLHLREAAATVRLVQCSLQKPAITSFEREASRLRLECAPRMRPSCQRYFPKLLSFDSRRRVKFMDVTQHLFPLWCSVRVYIFF